MSARPFRVGERILLIDRKKRRYLVTLEEGGEFHHTVFALDGGMLFGLHTHQGRESGDRADERRTGLDHISFGLSGTAELEQWRDRLDELGITHGGIKKAHYGSGVSFRDPDGIALEFFIAPGT